MISDESPYGVNDKWGPIVLGMPDDVTCNARYAYLTSHFGDDNKQIFHQINHELVELKVLQSKLHHKQVANRSAYDLDSRSFDRMPVHFNFGFNLYMSGPLIRLDLVSQQGMYDDKIPSYDSDMLSNIKISNGSFPGTHTPGKILAYIQNNKGYFKQCIEEAIQLADTYIVENYIIH